MLITNMQESGGLDRVGDNSISDLLKLYRCLPRPPNTITHPPTSHVLWQAGF